MLTKGYIVELSSKTNNKFKVRIPLFDSAGQDTLTNDDNIVEATLCYEPSNLNSYKVGDCVFIEFENDEESKPVILGKLFTTETKENRGLGNLDALNVSGKATLSLSSTLGGVELQKIIDNLKLSKTNSERIDQLVISSDLTEVKKQLNDEITRATTSESAISSSVENIATDVLTNTDNIKTNTDNIKTNTDNIKTNTDNIKTLQDEIEVTQGTSKGYVYNRDDGVSEMGQYIDFHYNKSSQDYSTRISTQKTTSGNTLTLPTTNGTLATQEYVDNKISSSITTVLNTAI